MFTFSYMTVRYTFVVKFSTYKESPPRSRIWLKDLSLIECQETYAMYFINPLMMSVKLHIINDNVNAYLN